MSVRENIELYNLPDQEHDANTLPGETVPQDRKLPPDFATRQLSMTKRGGQYPLVEKVQYHHNYQVNAVML